MQIKSFMILFIKWQNYDFCGSTKISNNTKMHFIFHAYFWQCSNKNALFQKWDKYLAKYNTFEKSFWLCRAILNRRETLLQRESISQMRQKSLHSPYHPLGTVSGRRVLHQIRAARRARRRLTFAAAVWADDEWWRWWVVTLMRHNLPPRPIIKPPPATHPPRQPPSAHVFKNTPSRHRLSSHFIITRARTNHKHTREKESERERRAQIISSRLDFCSRSS
jgi:hypothetical protein